MKSLGGAGVVWPRLFVPSIDHSRTEGVSSDGDLFSHAGRGVRRRLPFCKENYTGNLELSVSESAPNSATTAVTVALDVSAIKGIVLYSDRALTVKTNSASTPDNTIVLKAGVPYVWTTDSYDSLLLTADITSLHLVNASGGTAAFQMAAVVDPTP